VWLHLGAAQHALGKLELANGSFQRAIELDPASPEAYCAQAAVLAGLGRATEAEQVLRSAPDHAQVQFNLAVLLEARGEGGAARKGYQRALDIDPHHLGARLNLGAMKLDAGDAEGALHDFDAVIARSTSADAHANRARALLALFRDEEALAAAGEALAIDPKHRRALLDRAGALASLGRLEEADRLMPGGLDGPPHALELYFARAFERQFTCDWRDRDELTRRLRAALTSLSDSAISFKALSVPLSGAEQRVLADSIATARPAGTTPYSPKVSRRQRFRVGILSANIAAHPESYLLRRVVGDLDRQAFELRIYGLNPDDGSPLGTQLRRWGVVDLSQLPTHKIVERLRTDDLDLLVETSGYLRGAQPEVLKARVAPVQASYLSTPATLGAGIVDYRLSDAWTTPADTQADWAESLVLLPPPHFAYDNALRASRSEHGLRRAGVVLCCMNQAFKIEPEAFGVWMRLLGAVPGSVLWLLDGGALANANLRREAQARGVAPERLVFAPRVPLEEHLGRLADADLFLDTFCCNAHTTALDALWAGVPVLTRRGATMASRIASTFVRAAGLDELVVDTTEKYEQKALQLAGDPRLLKQLKQALARAKEDRPLFDTAARVRGLERAFTAMVERHRAGLPPDTLIID
jgi:predicted O-linked N-acetylglucosamine transferase (SPINDLY family)